MTPSEDVLEQLAHRQTSWNLSRGIEGEHAPSTPGTIAGGGRNVCHGRLVRRGVRDDDREDGVLSDRVLPER